MAQEKSQLKIGIVLNYVNMILGNLIPIFYTPIMLSLLGQSEYGLYKLASSVTSYLSLISMGLGSAITRYLIKSREEEGKEAEERMFGLFDVIFNGIAVATLIVGTLLTIGLPLWYAKSLTAAELSRMQLLVFMMVINMALNFSQSPYLSVVNAHEKFVFLQCINIIQTCGVPCLNLVALFMGMGSVGMTIAAMGASILTRIAYQIYVRHKMQMKPRMKNLPTNKMKEILGFSFWIFVANVVGQLYNATDTVMIGMVPALATTGVAVYNVGGMFNSMMFGLTTGVSNLLAPKTNRLVFLGAADKELTDLAIQVGRIQGYIMALIVSGFVAFGRPFIMFYAGNNYMEAYWIAILMMIPNMIPLVQSVCLNVIVAQNKHRFRSLVYLGIAVVNVVGTWFLMQHMGIVGAAFMTGVALIFGQGFAMNWYYHKKSNLNMVRFWKQIACVYRIPVLMCTVTLLISKFIDFYKIQVLLIGIMLYVVVYCILNWRFTMNNYEKNLILFFEKNREDKKYEGN